MDAVQVIVCCKMNNHELSIVQMRDNLFRVICDGVCISDSYYNVSMDVANTIYAASRVILSEVIKC